MNHYLTMFLLCSSASLAQVTLHPGDNVSKIVAANPEGTTFIFAPGTYRLSQPIVPKSKDKFFGRATCAPPASSCPAILTGAAVIGPEAKFDGVSYRVENQKQRNPHRREITNCDPGWAGCLLAEDLYFDSKPFRHLDSTDLPKIGSGEWWFDYPNHVIYFHDDPTGHTVETSVVSNAFGGPANNVAIERLTVEKFADMMPVGAIGNSQGAQALTQQTDWTIEHCEIRLNHAFGVRVNYRMRILNNYIHDNGQNGVGGGLGWKAAPELHSINSGILIQGNTISHNDYAHFNAGFGSGGVKIGATTGVTVRRNIIRDNEGAAIHFDDDCGSELAEGNTIIGNSDGDALVQEIGWGVSTFRNNIVLRNGGQLNGRNFTHQIMMRGSGGAEIYCNIMEVPPGRGVNGWEIGASDRGNSEYPPYQHRTSAGNYAHHNTVIWDAEAKGVVGLRQHDPQNQPDFFTRNKPPDYNEYHLPDISAAVFLYDNDNSRRDKLKIFRDYQAAGADVHGTVDTNYLSGYPSVSITSPDDQSTVDGKATIAAKASDKSGIRKVEFYVDWDLRETITSAPYQFNWTGGSAGTHTVAAMAYSSAGVRACYAVTLNRQ